MARSKDDRNRLKTAADAPPKPITPIQSSDLCYRKLWELCRRYGAPIADAYDRQGIEESLARAGYEAEPPTIEDINDYWSFESRTVKDYVLAKDVQGDFSAKVFADGRCELIRHSSPNRNARIPGVRYADEVTKIPNLESFAALMYMLLSESDNIFDESVAKTLKDRIEFEIRAAVAETVANAAGPTIHGADPRIEQLRLLAPGFGLVGPHAPTITELPFKLAAAMGVSIKRNDDSLRSWPEVADAVIEKGDRTLDEAGPAYHRNEQEPGL